ncbi:hypothetical protein K402DRAFT_345956 [Aulographum hederae CBS 113979]|uniref:DUF2470 domain-containing protein n=1 Tax=Aulographum hederae CBS 113979 TaxID=1176131 RepID=A0A6G1HE99_9PEZI|nr:hypothetical protein K402DRAFT_345956 [Aulographum hederae CBS 113979]
MASPDPQEAASKQRIITHMNADHQDSIVRYAEHFCKFTSFGARNAHLTDIALDKMVIEASGRRHIVPFTPPMSSWREARERLVAMDQETLKALSRSDITVKEYLPPKGFGAVVFAACATVFILLPREQTTAPGSLVDRLAPALASYARRFRLHILLPLAFLHSVECLLFVFTRLRKHTVPAMSLLWWKWTLSAFVEGIGSFQRYVGFFRGFHRFVVGVDAYFVQV